MMQTGWGLHGVIAPSEIVGTLIVFALGLGALLSMACATRRRYRIDATQHAGPSLGGGGQAARSAPKLREPVVNPANLRPLRWSGTASWISVAALARFPSTEDGGAALHP